MRRVVVGITGASGALYAVRFLKAALEAGLELEVVVTAWGQRLLLEECGLNLKADELGAWLDARYGPVQRTGSVRVHREGDLGASIASGSQLWEGMVVIPCSMKTLADIALGVSSNLLTRAADVTLKERRRLVLVPRETPLQLAHIENMRRVTLAGAVVLPAMPAFYFGPRSLEDLADFIAGRALRLLGVDRPLVPPWKG